MIVTAAENLGNSNSINWIPNFEFLINWLYANPWISYLKNFCFYMYFYFILLILMNCQILRFILRFPNPWSHSRPCTQAKHHSFNLKAKIISFLLRSSFMPEWVIYKWDYTFRAVRHNNWKICIFSVCFPLLLFHKVLKIWYNY